MFKNYMQGLCVQREGHLQGKGQIGRGQSQRVKIANKNSASQVILSNQHPRRFEPDLLSN